MYVTITSNAAGRSFNQADLMRSDANKPHFCDSYLHVPTDSTSHRTRMWALAWRRRSDDDIVSFWRSSQSSMTLKLPRINDRNLLVCFHCRTTSNARQGTVLPIAIV